MPKDKPELKLIARGKPSPEAIERAGRIMAQIFFRVEREEKERRRAEKTSEGA
jgi:hypothetical protein